MIHIRCLTADDLDFGMRLKAQAGWNQSPADWSRFLAMQPQGCFVAEWHGAAAGTAVVCLFGEVAWIAMVLVDVSLRGRGIGKALLQHALDFATRQGACSVRLDATPLGQPLYEQFGFVPQYVLTRYAGRLPASVDDRPADRVRLANSADYARILALDRAATHTDRSKFLVRLLAEQPDGVHVAERDGRLAGYYTTRAGSESRQLGPCIAEPSAGADLLQHALRRLAGEAVLLDVPQQNQPAARLAQAAGLQVQRRFMRMCRGANVADDLERLWISSGPELG